MPFNARLPKGGLVAMAFGDKTQPELLGAEKPRLKTVKLERVDYEGADTSAYNCPVARSIRRALRKDAGTRIAVWHERVRIGEHVYALPEEATQADRQYSFAGTVTLIEFQLSNERIQP